MKKYEVRELTNDEAYAKVRDLQTELARERAVLSSGTRPESPGRIKSIRRTIAKIKTQLRERELRGEKGPTAKKESHSKKEKVSEKKTADKKEKTAAVKKKETPKKKEKK